MGLFRRQRRDPSPPDPDFAFLTEEQAARVRDLARTAFAEIGVEVVVRSDHLLADDGTVYGLANLMATCHQAGRGERDWPDLVRGHVHRIYSATRDRRDPAELPVEDVLARVRLRAVGTATLPQDWRAAHGYGRVVADDVVELLCLDEPHTVVTLRQRAVDAFGVDVLRRAGLENLLREPIDAVDVLDVGDGAQVHAVLGDSMYTASRILVLPDLLRRVYGEREYPDGVLVAAPLRHQVLLHPVDGPAVLPAATALVRLARTGFAEGVGSVTPNVYWWRAGVFTRLTSTDPDSGRVVLRADGEFGEVLARLLG